MPAALFQALLFYFVFSFLTFEVFGAETEILNAGNSSEIRFDRKGDEQKKESDKAESKKIIQRSVEKRKRLAEPIFLSNQQLFIDVFGIPGFESARLNPHLELSFSYNFYLTNEYLFLPTERTVSGPIRQRNNVDRCFFVECIIFDYEKNTHILSFRFGLFDFMELGLDYKYITIGKGQLDHFVDGFHRFFEFSEGGREKIVSYRFLLMYVRDSDLIFQIKDAPDSGTGDILYTLGFSLYENSDETEYLSIKLRYKDSVGNENYFFGSGKSDAGGEVAYSDYNFYNDFIAFHFVGGVYFLETFGLMNRVNVDQSLEDADRRFQKDQIYYAYLAFNFIFTDSIALKTSVLYNSSVYRSDLEALYADAYQLVAGGSFGFGENLIFDIGISEDPISGTSPDFTLFSNLKYYFY